MKQAITQYCDNTKVGRSNGLPLGRVEGYSMYKSGSCLYYLDGCSIIGFISNSEEMSMVALLVWECG